MMKNFATSNTNNLCYSDVVGEKKLAGKEAAIF